MKFYWTDSVTDKGTLLYAPESTAIHIIAHYFEASYAPIKGIVYPKKAVKWRGFIR